MANIIIKMKNGTERRFMHTGRPGGSYTKRLTLENGFAIVKDEWNTRTIIPAIDIEEITETSHL